MFSNIANPAQAAIFSQRIQDFSIPTALILCKLSEGTFDLHINEDSCISITLVTSQLDLQVNKVQSNQTPKTQTQPQDVLKDVTKAFKQKQMSIE